MEKPDRKGWALVGGIFDHGMQFQVIRTHDYYMWKPTNRWVLVCPCLPWAEAESRRKYYEAVGLSPFEVINDNTQEK